MVHSMDGKGIGVEGAMGIHVVLGGYKLTSPRSQPTLCTASHSPFSYAWVVP